LGKLSNSLTKPYKPLPSLSSTLEKSGVTLNLTSLNKPNPEFQAPFMAPAPKTKVLNSNKMSPVQCPQIKKTPPPEVKKSFSSDII